jgi:hypothetical protein
MATPCHTPMLDEEKQFFVASVMTSNSFRWQKPKKNELPFERSYCPPSIVCVAPNESDIRGGCHD